jgi:hypothetical protein|tara:strand:+ start:1374 stop:1604 length:231 start_codon:yes stop_codon:yes gene_type:complete
MSDQVYHFKGNGDVQMKTYSKNTYEALKQVKGLRLTKVSVGLRQEVIESMRRIIKNSGSMTDDQVLVKYLHKTLKI